MLEKIIEAFGESYFNYIIGFAIITFLAIVLAGFTAF
jgi:hypothetical protein